MRKLSESGQSSIMFALLIPLFVIGMVFAVDFGRFLILQSQAQIFADGAATAAAGALDVSRFTAKKEIILNDAWANARANLVLETGSRADPQLADMSFFLSDVSISGGDVTVTVTASCPTVWAKPFGVGSYNTVAMASARAATGIFAETK